MLHQRVSTNSLSFILDKMRNKLSGWKASSLSFESIVTLAQSSWANIPGYVMHTCDIHLSVCDEAERICRNFIWGTTADHKRCNLVSWNQVCQPKEDGRLGFNSMRILNKAYIWKLSWNIIANPEALWVQVMRAKYNCGSKSMPQA